MSYRLKHLRLHLIISLALTLLVIFSLSTPRTARAIDPRCNQVSLSFSPSKATYRPQETVTIIATGVSPSTGNIVWFHWTRSTANTQLGGLVWTKFATDPWNPSTGRYEASLVIPNQLPGVSPYYSQSGNQEFIIAFTLYDSQHNQFICSGNPDPGSVPTHPELPGAVCSNCYKILVTRDELTGLKTNLSNYWNVQPGYSFTYLGNRLDGPEDDNGVPLPSSATNFVTRVEYEAPVSLCGVPLIPQRFTKSNRWGYWGAARPKRADRTGSIWTDGYRNLRFFLTSPSYTYPWEDSIVGAYGHKIYEAVNGAFQLGYLSNVLNRSIIHTSLNHENYYYPPYLLSYTSVPNSGQDQFTRIDSIYSILSNPDLQSAICQQRVKTEDHDWNMRVRLLTDNDLKSEFGPIQNYFPTTRQIVVLTFFEGGAYSSGKPELREDWYLMEGVGLVGVDQAKWSANDTTSLTTYFNATFMKQGTVAFPHVRMRANRGYIGGPLTITAISPSTSFPMTVPKGSCYTVGANSSTPYPLPYDGRLESDKGLTPPVPTLWIHENGEAVWANNGVVTVCLSSTFPSGTYTRRFRPYITKSPSSNETMLTYNEMPWSNAITIVVP